MFFFHIIKRKAGGFKFLRFGERFRDGLVWTVEVMLEGALVHLVWSSLVASSQKERKKKRLEL